MCLTPIRIKAKKTVAGSHGGEYVATDGYAVVPCGKCPDCKTKRANAWIFRLQKQERVHRNSLFVTLTYRPETCPISPKGFMTLVKEDVQKFMKRLRFNTGRKTIKYYFCGEYGTDTWRPHYHAIIFDCTHDEIDKAWGLGHIVVGTVTGASIGYCTKYICKEKRVPAHANDDRLPEFALMSKNMGKNYLTPQMTQWHRDNMASYVVAEGGFQQPLPRYYRDFIFDENQKLALNYVNQAKNKDLFDERVQQAGGVLEFYRIQYDHIKQMLTIHKERQRQNRNKI